MIDIKELLAVHWGVHDAAIEIHNGGMNSATWWVEYGGGVRAVAKHTPGWNKDEFVGGLTVATIVQDAGIPTGAPIPTTDGRLAVRTDDGPVALLRFVPGMEPPDDESGLRMIGATLGRVHLILKGRRAEGAQELYRLDADAEHLDGTPAWVRPGIRGALAHYDALGPRSLTWGMLHTDPAPEAFLVHPETGEVALIDWSVATYGPLLYDVASAVMYVDGPDQGGPMLDAYLGSGALTTEELRRGLDVLRRYRWAIQATYFAGRIADGDMTGIDDPKENEEGLLAAREHLEQ